jgi:hypothetical protein
MDIKSWPVIFREALRRSFIVATARMMDVITVVSDGDGGVLLDHLLPHTRPQ